MSEFTEIICEKQGGICIIKINRPKVLNALVPSVFYELNQALDEIEADPEIRVVIITGEGRAFAAGADITYMKDLDAKGAKAFATHITSVLRRMESMEQIFIAAVNGYALGGGCELSMACDLRITEAGTRFFWNPASDPSGWPYHCKRNGGNRQKNRRCGSIPHRFGQQSGRRWQVDGRSH